MRNRDIAGRFVQGIILPVVSRFLSKIDPATARLADGTFDPTVCWLWVGAKKFRRSGHIGWFYFEGRAHPATRIALAIKTGELRETDQACHTRNCQTGGLCANWHHLYWGSIGENVADHEAVYGKWGVNKRYVQRADAAEAEVTAEAGGAAGGPADPARDPYAGAVPDDTAPF